MTWNYRVCKETYAKGTAHEEVGYTVREVFYDEDGKITNCGVNSASVFGENVEEIKIVLERMLESINKDIVDVDAVFPQPVEDKSLD